MKIAEAEAAEVEAEMEEDRREARVGSPVGEGLVEEVEEGGSGLIDTTTGAEVVGAAEDEDEEAVTADTTADSKLPGMLLLLIGVEAAEVGVAGGGPPGTEDAAADVAEAEAAEGPTAPAPAPCSSPTVGGANRFMSAEPPPLPSAAPPPPLSV